MWAWAIAASAAPCDPAGDTVGALAAVLAGDSAAGRARLDAAQAAFACAAPADPPLAARWFLLDAAVTELEGDREAAADSWAAARATSAETWLPDLGAERRARYDAAPHPAGSAPLLVSPGGRELWVDGARLQGDPATIPAGLHLVQVVEGDVARWADVTFVEAGVTRALDTGLPPLPPPPAPAAPAPAPAPPGPPRPDRGGGPSVVVRAAVGATVALGGRLASGPVVEPAAKVVVPAVVSGAVPLGPAFVRGEVGAGWLLGGRWLSSTAAGEVAASPLQLLGAGAVGLGDRARVGLSGGVAWPARLSVRGLAGWDRGPFTSELRLGVNVPTERAPEPAGELLVGLRR